MQRAPCSCNPTTGSVPTNSWKSCTRSAGSRSGFSIRSSLMKAPSCPIRAALPSDGGFRGLVLGLGGDEALAHRRDRMFVVVDDVAVAGGGQLGQGALVVVRHHLHERGECGVPLVEHARG